MGTRRLFVAGLLVFGAGLVQAGAQTYPSQTIKIVVPFIAGGPVDSLARVMVQHLPERLGQNIIVENRTGGGTSHRRQGGRGCRAGRPHAALHRAEPRPIIRCCFPISTSIR